MGEIFKFLFYQPIFNLLMFFYKIFGENLGIAIIAVALFSRIVTFPVTRMQIKAAEKGKDFQKKYNDLKEKYSKNKEKMNDELMKLQSKFLPTQLSGCLPIIVLIVFLIYVRGAIVDLVQKGWHSYNEIAYLSTMKKAEDSIKFKTPTELSERDHIIKLYVEADNGSKIEKEYKFIVTADINSEKEKIKSAELSKSKEEKNEEIKMYNQKVKDERDSGISIYSDVFNKNLVSVEIKKFLIFTTESKTVYIFTQKNIEFEFFLRAPSNKMIQSEKIRIYLDDADITSLAEISQGERLNLDFLGMDLSKVATDFSINDPKIIPYIVLAILVGFTQWASTEIIKKLTTIGVQKPVQKKKEKKSDEDPIDTSEMMNMMNKQMMYFFPVLTVLTSLGFWGGASVFPAGISLFWTVQSLFVIMQQLYAERAKINLFISEKFNKKR